MNQSPVIETREHETTENCWCAPILEYSDPQTGNQIWVHNNTPNLFFDPLKGAFKGPTTGYYSPDYHLTT
jgi:hypothetical protein